MTQEKKEVGSRHKSPLLHACSTSTIELGNAIIADLDPFQMTSQVSGRWISIVNI